MFLAAVIGWGSLLLQTSAKAAVFGDGHPENGIEDQRLVTTQPQLRSVGTVVCDGGLRGTATHIKASFRESAAPIIVTAAHILFEKKSGKMYLSCSYLPQNRRLSAIPFYAISEHDYNPFAADKIEQSETDIVFIALAGSLQQPALSLTEAPNINDQKLSLLGYNSDLNDITESANCETFVSAQFASEKLLLHDCDARSGASGGPLLLQLTSQQGSEPQPSVIAIHGGTLFLHPQDDAEHSTNVDGAVADPERWVNQARKVDQALLERLRRFNTYLAKGFPDQS